MDGFFPFAVAAGQPSNPDEVLDFFVTSPDAVQITNSNGANALSAWYTLGTTNVALSGLKLFIGMFSSTSARFHLHIRVNGGAAWPGIPLQGVTNMWQSITVPIKVPAGALIEVQVRASANGSSMYVSAAGIMALSTLAPGFDALYDVAGLVTGTTRPSATDVPNTDTWTPLGSLGAGNTAGALIISASDTGAAVAVATGYRGLLRIGVGATGSEVQIHQQVINVQNSAPYVHTPQAVLVRKALAANATISAKISVTTPNSDLFHVGIQRAA